MLSARAELPLGVYRNHQNEQNKIALTFDDGPHPRFTREILAILDEYGVTATFFFVGENVSYYSDTARDCRAKNICAIQDKHTEEKQIKIRC